MRYQGNSKEVVTVTYQGTATISRPTPGRPWGWTEEHATCGHKHPTWQKAEKCGQQLGARVAAAANAEWRNTVGMRRCVLATGTEDRVYDNDPGYIRYCTTHDTSATRFHRSVEEAEADEWHCPWE